MYEYNLAICLLFFIIGFLFGSKIKLNTLNIGGKDVNCKNIKKSRDCVLNTDCVYAQYKCGGEELKQECMKKSGGTIKCEK